MHDCTLQSSVSRPYLAAIHYSSDSISRCLMRNKLPCHHRTVLRQRHGSTYSIIHHTVHDISCSQKSTYFISLRTEYRRQIFKNNDNHHKYHNNNAYFITTTRSRRKAGRRMKLPGHTRTYGNAEIAGLDSDGRMCGQLTELKLQNFIP